MQYRLRVLDSAGVLGTVSVDARDEADARSQARAKALKVLSADQLGSKAALPSIGGGRFSATLFCEELLSMLAAGLSIVECVEGLASKEESATGRAMFERMLARLREGRRFSEALGGEAALFPPLLIAIVRASERTSSLPDSLDRYLRYQAQIEGMTRHLLSASIYPLILFAVGGLVVTFLMGFVVPKFATVYKSSGRELPLLSQWMLVWGGFAGHYAAWLIGGMAALMATLAVLAKGFFARHGLTGAMARIPGLRERSRLIELSRLYMTQGMLMAGGIPAVEALELAATVLSPASRERSVAALRGIRNGQPLSDAFDAAGLATPISLKYFRAGERSGNLADMLTRAARFYDDELARFIERFSKAFEPLLMAAIGVVVGVIVVMLYLPIFDLAGSLG